MSAAVQKALARHARRHAPRRQGLDLETLAVRLCRGHVVLGRRFAVGPYTPATPDPAGYTWAVTDRAGAAVVLAFDAWEAGRWLLLCEAGTIDAAGSAVPIRLPTDAEAAAVARETSEELAYWFSLCDQWIAIRRRQKKVRAA